MGKAESMHKECSAKASVQSNLESMLFCKFGTFLDSKGTAHTGPKLIILYLAYSEKITDSCCCLLRYSTKNCVILSSATNI